MGRGFKSGGRYVYLRLIHVDVWQKPTQHCKVIIIQLKINFKTHTIIILIICNIKKFKMLLRTEEDQILTIFNLENLNKEDSYETAPCFDTFALLFCRTEVKESTWILDRGNMN